jgi:hypothetical protein
VPDHGGEEPIEPVAANPQGASRLD